MIATLCLAQVAQPQNPPSSNWLFFMVVLAVTAAAVLLFAAWANRHWRKK
ncbi:MAG TPA: hypothetical protein VGI81_19085 [Tepidisphaeraceae bacterium]|jgi:hypothetical protein